MQEVGKEKMTELKKILEEMQEVKEIMLSPQNIDCFGEPCRENDCLACVVNKCMEIVKKHMNDGWIPVEERLPEEDGFYLCTMDGKIVGEEEPFTGISEFENGLWIDDDIDYRCIIAWRPLPEPYRPER